MAVTSFKLIAHGVTPKSLNQTLGKHWRARHRETKRWREHIGKLCMVHGVSSPKLERAKITITRLSFRPIKDHDNFVGGCKPLLDALVTCEIIQDDDRELITVEYKQEKVREKVLEATEIVIESVG